MKFDGTRGTVRLAFGFEVLAQLGAGAVYLVPAVEVLGRLVVAGVSSLTSMASWPLCGTRGSAAGR